MGMTHDKIRFAFLMAKHTEATLWDVERLLRYGTTYKRLQEAHCNGDCPYCGKEAGWLEVCPKEQRIEAKIQALGQAVIFEGDPRGYTLRVIPANKYISAIGVPTS